MTDSQRKTRGTAIPDDLGYTPVLARTMGLARSTMVNISTSSVTTAMFTLFAFGLFTGGTPFVWIYALGFLVMLPVTMMFAELGSSMPIAGALYPWASRLLGARAGYAVGWLYVAAQTAITAAVAFGIAPFAASLFDITMSPREQAFAAIAIVVISTLVNLVGVAIASTVASIGAIAEVVGMLILVVVVAIAGFGNQSAEVLVHPHGVPDGSSFISVALVTMLFGAWAFTGLEMSSDMAEETQDARRVIPKAAIASITTTFVVGMIFLLVMVLAIPDLDGIFASANPLQDIIQGNTNAWFYDAAIVIVVLAVFVAAVTNQALTARALFSLARDSKVPASQQLVRVSESTKVPALAIIVIGTIASVLLLFTKAIGVIAVACLTALFTCYMIVIWGQLIARLRGTWSPTHWNLGRFSLPINIFAAVAGTALTLNVAWPRGEAIWYEKWSGFAFTGATLLLALAYYLVAGTKARAAIDSPAKTSVGDE